MDNKRFNPIKNKEIRYKYHINNDEVLILFIGHLEEFKGLFELIYAFNNLIKENKKAKLMLIGEGSQRNYSLEVVSRLGLEKFILFVGKIPPSDIHKYYQSADIFVLPSHTDAGGPPVVFIEAMACGLPVIGTSIGGIPEGIENGVNGFIVPPKNVDKLTEKIDVLLKDGKLRKEFGNNSLKKDRRKFYDIKTKNRKAFGFILKST